MYKPWPPKDAHIEVIPLKRWIVGLHERMRSTDFGAVDSAIASGFEDCEIFSISGFEDQAIDKLLLFCQ